MNRFQDVVVIPYRRTTRTAGMTSDLELGKAAGARFALQGAVRRDAQTVKVSTQLTDAKSGRQIWWSCT